MNVTRVSSKKTSVKAVYEVLLNALGLPTFEELHSSQSKGKLKLENLTVTYLTEESLEQGSLLIHMKNSYYVISVAWDGVEISHVTVGSNPTTDILELLMPLDVTYSIDGRDYEYWPFRDINCYKQDE